MEKLMTLMVGLEEATTEAVQNTGQMDMFNNMFSFFMIAAGVFALYSAITGKGPAYNNDYPKSMKEEANKLLRKFLWILGPVATITGIIDFAYGEESWTALLGICTVFPILVVYFIMFRRKFKDDLKKMR